MRFSAKFLLCFVFIFITSFFIATKSFAQTIPTSTSAATQYNTSNTNPDVPKNLHTYTQNVMIETMSALICQIAGTDPINPNGQCLGIDSKTGKLGFTQNSGGAIGLMSNAIVMLYTPPMHGNEYLKNLASNFGFVKSAHAEEQEACNNFARGTGFCGLTPLLGLWTAMRNIVYLLFVLVFVFIGFAIMIRIKIDPRTVMTIQNQIPKLIVAILLVTFSYSIAGFVIDIMYTSIYLAGNVIVTADPDIQDPNLVTNITKSTNPFSVANGIGGSTGKVGGLSNIAWEPSKSVAGFISPIFDNTPGKLVTGVAMGTLGKIMAKPTSDVIGGILVATGGLFGTFTGGPPGTAAGIAAGAALANVIKYALPIGGTAIGVVYGSDLVGGFVSIIAYLVISIAVLMSLFRLWFALIRAYLFFVINVVFSPFWMLLGVFPGGGFSFTLWLREIISDLAVFPVVIVMFLIGRVLMDQFAHGKAAFVPPMVGNYGNPEAFSSLIGLGIILMTPAMLERVKEILKAPKVDLSPVYTALGGGAGVVTGTAKEAIGSTAEYTLGNPLTKEKGGKALVQRLFKRF